MEQLMLPGFVLSDEALAAVLEVADVRTRELLIERNKAQVMGATEGPLLKFQPTNC